MHQGFHPFQQQNREGASFSILQEELCTQGLSHAIIQCRMEINYHDVAKKLEVDQIKIILDRL